MEKVVKSYIEKLYPDVIFYESIHEEVDDRNPLLVEYDDLMVGFRFYDKINKIKINYSNWFFIGERLKLFDVIDRYGNDQEYGPLISNMKSNGLDVCLTPNNIFIPLEKGAITYDEYVENKKTTKVLK